MAKTAAEVVGKTLPPFEEAWSYPSAAQGGDNDNADESGSDSDTGGPVTLLAVGDSSGSDDDDEDKRVLPDVDDALLEDELSAETLALLRAHLGT